MSIALVAAIVAMYCLIFSVTALAKRRIRAGVMWLVTLGLSAWVAVAMFPGVPDRNQGMAMGDCRAVLSAQQAYQSVNGGSFGELKCLASPASCGFAADTPSPGPGVLANRTRASAASSTL